MDFSNIATRHFDIFIAYHGDEETGSLSYAKKIYNLLKTKKIAGKPLEIFLQTETNFAGQFSLTPMIAQNSTLFILVARGNIPTEANGTLLQNNEEGIEKRLFQEVKTYADSIPYLKNPSSATRVIACDGLGFEEASRLFYIFNGKNHFSFDEIMSGKTKELFDWIQYNLGQFDSNENSSIPVLNTFSIPYYSSFIARDDELRKIHQELSNNNFLIVTATSQGMGINTLAKNYARKYASYYESIHYIEGPHSTIDIILGLSFKGYEKYDLLPREVQFLEKKKLFLRLNSKTLIIVADFNMDYMRDEYFYDVIASAHCKLVITSSYKTNIYPCLEVKPMENSDLLKLFRHYCQIPYTDEELISFFKQVNRHTSVITLVANLINSTDLELSGISTNMLNIEDQVYLEQTRSYDSINNHLLNVFNLSRTFLSANELELLSILSLIDVNGIERSMLTNFLNIKLQYINDLKNKGYLYIAEERPVRVFLPTVISNLIYHNFPPSLETYEKAVKLINEIIRFNENETKSIEYHKNCCKYGEFLISKRKLFSNKETIMMLNHLAMHYHANAYLPEALKISNLALDIYKENSEDLEILKFIYMKRSIILEDMGLYKEALNILNEIIPYVEENNLASYDLGVLYNNLGAIKRRMGDLNASLAAHEKALALFHVLNKNDLKVSQGIAIAYNDLGSTYEKLGKKEVALEKKLESLKIRENLLSLNQLDIAKSYNNVGNSYNQIGDYEKALIYEKKSLEIREKALPEIHPDIAKTYNNMGMSYRKLKKFEDSILCYDKAIQINDHLSGASIPNLAFSMYYKALTLVDMCDFKGAIKVLEYSVQKTITGNYEYETTQAYELMFSIYTQSNDQENMKKCANTLKKLYTEYNNQDKLQKLSEIYE